MAPATALATHTMPPTVSASTRCSMPVCPIARKMSDVSSTAATVMPLIGFDELPICPVIRLETVTNRKANSTASTAASSDRWICGSTIIRITSASEPPATTPIGRSRSVRTSRLLLSPSPRPRP